MNQKTAYLKGVLLLLGIMLASSLWSQTKKINGKVSSAEDGKPLVGVSVAVKGTKDATQTDTEGIYSIDAAIGQVLVFTSVGFDAVEMPVTSSSTLDLALQVSLNKMDEVVVIGYGTQSRKNVTNSVSKLDNQVLQNAPRANVGSALQGTLPGLRVTNTTGSPGATPSILLRGGASINNPGSPLVLVDGVIRSFEDIPADDIASIEVLKDASSTAIYGARANNGVILVTTKQAKAGKAELSYKYIGGLNVRREGLQYLGAKDYIYYQRLGNLNSGRTLAQVNASRGFGLSTSVADLALFDIRAFTPANANLLSRGWDTVGDPYNPGSSIIFKDHGGEIEDIIFRNTQTHNHYLSASGGNEKGKYFASFDYYKEAGVIIGSDYNRYSGNLNGSYKVRPNLEISSGVVLSTASQLGTIGSEINTFWRNLSIWPTMNPWLDSAKTIPNPGNGLTDGNPLYWLDKLKRTSETNRITVNAAVKYDIMKGLYVKVSGNAYLLENLDKSFQRATQLYANLYTNPPSFNNTNRNSIAAFSRTFQKQFNAIVNYSKIIAEKHDINAMIGAEYYDTKDFNMRVFGQNAPTDDISTVNASTTFVAGNNFSNESQLRIISNFGRLNYGFDNRYLVSLVYRQDGVSNLAGDNRWGFFPGMSAGWNVHNEKFFKNSFLSKYIDLLKPRISYGRNGNVAGVGRYEVQGAYGATGLYNGSAGFLNTGIINSGLVWEKSQTTDIGLDMALLNNRVNIIFEYYDRRTNDLLTNLALPSYTGFNSVRTNLGKFQNRGYEIALNTTILKKPNGLKLDVGVNAAFVANKILQLPFNGNENNRQGGLQIFDPSVGKVVWVGGLQQGQTLGNIFAFKQVSIFSSAKEIETIAANRIDLVGNISGPNRTYGSGKIVPGDVNWMDLDKNDTIDVRDQVYIGNTIPRWTGGFTLSASYKNFSIFSRFDYALGHTIYNDNYVRVMGNFQGTFNYLQDIKNAWSVDNPNSDIPRVTFADQVSAPQGKKNYTRINNAGSVLNSNNSRFYERGDYLACREITLAYDFPKTFLSRTKAFSKARIYFNANNIFYITKYSGASPEPPGNGIDAGTYPVPRSYAFGVQVSF